MRRFGCVLFACVLLLFFAVSAKADSIFSDGFENNFDGWTHVDGNWTASGGNVYSGSKRAQVDGTGAVESVLYVLQPTTGYENLSTKFYYRVAAGIEGTDVLKFRYTTNGTDWQDLKVYQDVATNAVWEEEIISLPQETWNNPLFGLGFYAAFNSGASSDCFHLDQVSISGNPAPEPSALIFFLSGVFPIFALLKNKRR